MTDAADLADLTGIYRDLHAHPELAFAEHRTAEIVAARLRDLGYQTTTGVGGTGVVGLLANGDGPTVLLRADMDGLPVLERTGLDYASADHGQSADGKQVPVMHACGHDAHVTCLLGAAAELAADASSWSGTLLLVSVRTFDQGVRAKVLTAIERIATAEAAASGAKQPPEIISLGAFPVVVNDAAACAKVTDAFAAALGPGLVLDPGPVTGSEDVGLLATASGAPCAYWLLGCADPALFAGIASLDEARSIVETLPSNHSPLFAPVIEQTLRTGVAALTSAARAWLAAADRTTG